MARRRIGDKPLYEATPTNSLRNIWSTRRRWVRSATYEDSTFHILESGWYCNGNRAANLLLHLDLESLSASVSPLWVESTCNPWIYVVKGQIRGLASFCEREKVVEYTRLQQGSSDLMILIWQQLNSVQPMKYPNCGIGHCSVEFMLPVFVDAYGSQFGNFTRFTELLFWNMEIIDWNLIIIKLQDAQTLCSLLP